MLLDRRGRDLQAITPPGSFRQPRFSPDGSRVVAERTEDGGNSDLWVYDLVRRSAVRLTQSEAPDVKPVWSPDGRSIAFSSKRGAVFQVFIKTVDGTERERSLIVSDTDKFVESWSPDGKYLSGTLRESGLWIMPLSAGAKARRVRTNMRTENWQSEFSPDGRWLAYTSLESESPEVYVEPFPATGERWQLSTHGGAEPHWRLDAKELWYLDANGWLMAIDCSSADWQHAVPRPMFRVSVMELAGPSDFSISPDGERIVVNTFIGDPVVPPVQVVLNWTGLLSR
jgi:Tol biopolymer transport system component